MDLLEGKNRKVLINQKKGEEFEIIFNKNKKITHENAVTIKDFFSEEKKAIKSKITTLDIFYAQKRLTLEGVKSINRVNSFSKNRSNKEILLHVVNQDNLLIIEKKPNKNITFYNSSTDTKHKISEEKKIDASIVKNLLEKMSDTENVSLFFRFKNRLSFLFLDNEDVTIQLDVSIVQEGSNLKVLKESPRIYEVELEFFKKTSSYEVNKKDISIFNEAMNKVYSLLNSVGDKEHKMDAPKNNINNDLEKRIIEKYKTYTKIFKNELYTIHPVSLDKNTYYETIPFDFSVTDKCDGEKVHVFVINQEIFLLDNILRVTKFGQDRSLPLKKDYILEAEKSENRIMIFDILIYEGVSLFDHTHIERNIYLTKFFEGLGDFPTFKFVKVKTYPQNIEDLLELYQKNMELYIDFIKNNPSGLFHKYTIFNSGMYGKNEIYHYASLLWRTFVKMPYLLDGIIFTNSNNSYRVKKNSIYKWKPDEYNSIDFYVRFRMNNNNQREILVNNGKRYVILELYCYSVNSKKEHYLVPFKDNQNLHVAYIETKGSDIYDSNNEKIMDKSILEMVYNKSIITSDSQFFWTIIRIRHDKTLYTNTNNKKFGNHIYVANKIFEIKLNPYLLQSPLNEFSGTTFSNKKKDLYYEKNTKVGGEMRNFHNHIKNMLISMYCKDKEVLDIGCGRGGDIIKFVRNKVKFVVGIDVNYMDLFVISDCAQNRYDNLFKKDSTITPIVFICSDFRLPLEINSQSKRSMVEDNIKKIKLYLDSEKKFDVINFSFSFHYFYDKLDNNRNKILSKNLLSKLNEGGYILITVFDSEKVLSFLGDKEERSESFLNRSGKKEILFSIKKLGDTKISLHNAIYNYEGNYYEENLVPKQDLVLFMRKKVRCELVETMLFEEYMRVSKPMINIIMDLKKDIIDKEKKLHLFLNNPEDSSEIEASRELSKLYRFYIFRKSDV